MTIYFWADPHLGHANIIKHCNRPFDSVDEMDTVLLRNWRKRVKSSDSVFVLGDVAMNRKYAPIIKALPGTKFLICGNHDKKVIKDPKDWGFVWKKDIYLLSIDGGMRKGGYEVHLGHYAGLTWEKKFHGSYHVFGHSHGYIKNPMPRSCDVGVDCWNYAPVSFEEVIDYIKTRDADKAPPDVQALIDKGKDEFERGFLDAYNNTNYEVTSSAYLFGYERGSSFRMTGERQI